MHQFSQICKKKNMSIPFALDLGYGVQRHFQQYFSYIVAVSFIGGENLSQVTDKLLHNVVLSTHRHEQGSNS